MTHPAIDEAAAARLRDQVAAPGSAIVHVEPSDGPTSPGPEPKPRSIDRLKAKARRAAVPVVARVRQELDRAGAQDLAELRAEVASLREELVRTRAEQAAELAAIHEELASVRPPKASA